MYDFLEDYAAGDYYVADRDLKLLTQNESQRKELLNGAKAEDFNEFIFPIKEVDDRYYLSEKVAKYVLQSMHKMHRAGVDNYVTYNKAKGIDGLRKLTPRECLRLMGFKDDFKLVVSNTSAYMEAGNSIVVDVLIALLKQMDITKYGIDNEE